MCDMSITKDTGNMDIDFSVCQSARRGKSKATNLTNEIGNRRI